MRAVFPVLQLVLQTKAGLEQSVVESGHSFAMTRLAAQKSVAGWVSEAMGGISYLQFIRELATKAEGAWPEVLANLEAIRAYVIQRDGVLINLTGEEGMLADVAPAAARLVESLPSGPQRQPVEWTAVLPEVSEAFTVPTQVAFTSKAASLYSDAGEPYDFNLTGSLLVATNSLSTGYLWDRIRVAGGAYGAGVVYDLTDGMLSFYSYRDPGLLSTVEVFDSVAQVLAEEEPSTETLTKSIVGQIGSIDSYQLPDAKGLTALTRHILEISDEERQARRNQVLATIANDFRSLAPLFEVVAEQGRVASVASQPQVDAAQAQQPDFFSTVQRVL